MDRAVELNHPKYHLLIRSDRARAKAQTDQTADALAEALEVATVDVHDPAVLCNLACTYALLSPKLADQQQELLDRAMEFLNKAVAAGYDKAESLAKDPDLDPLRERDDFKSLLATFTEKQPPSP